MVPAPLQRLLVVSPHCDDAVFSCGALLHAHPGSTVVTVFAAGPDHDDPLTDWDCAAGFQPGEDVMARRRHEDWRALSLLSAHPLWLEFHDSQYRRNQAFEPISQALQGVLYTVKPHAIFTPWGLFHSDHRLTSDACLALRRHFSRQAWFFYEDAIYRRIPELLSTRIALVRAGGHRARRTAVHSPGDAARKLEAVHCYQSQLKALTSRGPPGYQDVFEPERFWLIEPAHGRSDRMR